MHYNGICVEDLRQRTTSGNGSWPGFEPLTFQMLVILVITAVHVGKLWCTHLKLLSMFYFVVCFL